MWRGEQMSKMRDGRGLPTERHPVKFCQSFAPVRLYLDDIEQIVAYLLELSPEADLVLATPRRQVATVEGLGSLGRPEVSALEIRCSANPRRVHDFVVAIGPESVFLCRTGDTLTHRRVFAEIETLLLERRRRGKWRKWLLAAAGVLGPLSGTGFLFAQSGVPSWLPYVVAALAGVSLSLSALYLVTKRWSSSRVILVKRQDHRVHWEYMTGAFIILALISMMALVTLGFALLSRFWSAR
jgi:hypothetical protein